MPWVPTSNLRWVQEPVNKAGWASTPYLEQEWRWDPPEWDPDGTTKWVRVPTVVRNYGDDDEKDI